MAKISARSRFKLAQIKKDFVAWHKDIGQNAVTFIKYS